MNLDHRMDALPLLREAGEPADEKPIELVVGLKDLRRLPDWLKARKHLRINHIYIPDAPTGAPIELRLPPWHGSPKATAGLAGLGSRPDLERVFLHPSAFIVQYASMLSPELASEKVWLAGDLDETLKKRSPLPGFYEKSASLLEEAANLMNDALGRYTFAARVLALETGDPGYLPIAPFAEYEHPEICPEAGDVMMDGGLSDMVWAQEKFSRAVGPEGVINGFEPIRWMADKAAATLAACGNYRVHRAGLGKEDGSAVFSSLRDSSHIGATEGAGTETCHLRSMDSFARETGLERLDCVKLDIEGAELDALDGGREIISRDKPKLIVCLYHKPRDLYEVPLRVRELSEDYSMTCAHSSAGFTDTILYAKARGRNIGKARDVGV